MNKGQRVKVRAIVASEYYYDMLLGWTRNKAPEDRKFRGDWKLHHDPLDDPPSFWKPGENPYFEIKCLFRKEVEFEAIYIGTTVRKTGKRVEYCDNSLEGMNERSAELSIDVIHSVLMVINADVKTYRKPVACLIEDLELID